MTLIELAERVEKASGPDREIDLAIWRTVDPRAAEVEAAGRRPLEWLHRYTSSLDAAMSLVPEGHIWMVANCGASGLKPDLSVCTAVVGRSDYTHDPTVEAATPALALCAAALRARAGGDGWQFVATISGRMCQIDSVSELLRLINGGARIESISAAPPAGVSTR